MEVYIVDAFTSVAFAGNQAGVALLDGGEFPSDERMCQLAKELKHSETVFVKTLGPDCFHLRYFTPTGEVDLCGHATIAAFTVLRKYRNVTTPVCRLETKAATLSVALEGDVVWMDMAPPQVLRTFTPEQAVALYGAYGLTVADGIEGFAPKLVSTGLADILLPVKDRETLRRALQQKEAVTEISKQYQAVGFHLFALGQGDCTAYCRNFAPLYGIDEEDATGTANGALTHYLHQYRQVKVGVENCFFQGNGTPSEIKSRLVETQDGMTIQIGGGGVVTMACKLLC